MPSFEDSLNTLLVDIYKGLLKIGQKTYESRGDAR